MSQMLDDTLRKKIENLLQQSMKFSLEMEKLSQRGVYIVFPDSPILERMRDFFSYEPRLLFVTGPAKLFNDGRIPVSSTLSEHLQNGCNGILVADAPFNELLRNENIVKSLSQSCMALVSDVYYSAAGTRSANDEEPRQCSQRSVFISGSRSQDLIPQTIQDSLNEIMNMQLLVLIGDSNKGVDNEICDYLRKPLYPNVSIYTVNKRARIKVESAWKTVVVETNGNLKGQEKQMVKDRAMAGSAYWGLAVFNPLEKTRYGTLRISAGTLRNAIQLLLNGKSVKFFYVYEGNMLSKNLKSIHDIEFVIDSYKNEQVIDIEREMILSSRGYSPNDNVAMYKYSLINRKYQSLLKTERRLLSNDLDGNSSPFPAKQSQMSLFA